MRRVALTGGIGTGKSHVVALFRQHSVPTIESDHVSRASVEPGKPAHTSIRDRFGASVFEADGTLNRRALANTIFSNPSARADLEAIIHPTVRQAIDDWFKRCADNTTARFAIADIPLLFETGLNNAFDHVVVVACPAELQIDRIIKRDGISDIEARKRLAAQLPIQDKTDQADWVVRTDCSYEETARQVKSLYLALSQRQIDRHLPQVRSSRFSRRNCV